MTLGEMIRLFRIEKEITPEQLIGDLYSLSEYEAIEYGEKPLPYPLIAVLADRLGHEVYDLAEIADADITMRHYQVFRDMYYLYQHKDLCMLQTRLDQHMEALMGYDNRAINYGLCYYQAECERNLRHDYNQSNKWISKAWKNIHHCPHMDMQMFLLNRMETEYLSKREQRLMFYKGVNERDSGNYYLALDIFEFLEDYVDHHVDSEHNIKKIQLEKAKCLKCVKMDQEALTVLTDIIDACKGEETLSFVMECLDQFDKEWDIPEQCFEILDNPKHSPHLTVVGKH